MIIALGENVRKVTSLFTIVGHIDAAAMENIVEVCKKYWLEFLTLERLCTLMEEKSNNKFLLATNPGSYTSGLPER